MKKQFASAIWPCLMLLGGCSLSGIVTHSTLDYNRVLETVTNDMLVTNILLARDQAPLQFTDLSQIRGSLQLQAQTQVAEPFGSEFTSEDRPRAMLSGMVGGASNPTFDVVPLNTREFTEGITAPIDTEYFQYFLNKEQDSDQLSTIARLLFDKVRLVWKDDEGTHGCGYPNDPDLNIPSVNDITCAREAQEVFGHPGSDVGYFNYVVTALLSDAIYVRKQPAIIGPGITVTGPDLLRGAGAFAAGGLSIQERHSGHGPGSRYYLTKESRDGVYCLQVPADSKVSSGQHSWLVINIAALGDPVSLSAGEDPASVCNGHHAARRASASSPAIYLYGRSVESIFQYLGRMLTYPPQDRVIPFYIDAEKPKRPRFSVDYRGTEYYVSESHGACRGQGSSSASSDSRSCDHGDHGVASGFDRGDQTLFVLSVLNQLLDLYKKGSDIPVTPAVEAVH